MAEIRPDSAQTWQNSAQTWPNSAQTWQTPTKFGRNAGELVFLSNLMDSRPNLTESGGLGPNFSEFGLNLVDSVRVGRTWLNSGPDWPKSRLCRVWPNLAEFPPQSGNFGRGFNWMWPCSRNLGLNAGNSRGCRSRTFILGTSGGRHHFAKRKLVRRMCPRSRPTAAPIALGLWPGSIQPALHLFSCVPRK